LLYEEDGVIDHYNSNMDGGWIVSSGLNRTVWRVLWHPDYECELVIVSNDDDGEINAAAGASPAVVGNNGQVVLGNGPRDSRVEIWDVRKGWIDKWAVGGSAGRRRCWYVCSNLFPSFRRHCFCRPTHALGAAFAGNVSPARQTYKPIDAILRTSITEEESMGSSL